jgi:hypothetical protein
LSPNRKPVNFAAALRGCVLNFDDNKEWAPVLSLIEPPWP